MNNMLLKIKNKMSEKNLTQKIIAQKMNKTEQTIRNYLSGRTKLEVDILIDFAKILQVPVSYFFDEAAADQQAPSKNNIIINGGTNPQNNTINIKISEQPKEIENLKKEIEYLKQLLQQKDEIINLLKKNLE